jgi:hypothetical protein
LSLIMHDQSTGPITKVQIIQSKDYSGKNG